MAKINAEQLNLIREYFLSDTGDQNPEISGMTGNQIPEPWLTTLGEIFTSDEYSKQNLACYLREEHSEDFLDQLDELQQEFLFNQAELLIAGKKNKFISELLNRSNKNFLNEVAFQKAIKQNIRSVALEESNKAFLAIHQQRLKESAPAKRTISPDEKVTFKAKRQKSSDGKIIAPGKAVAASTAAAGFTFRLPEKKAAQKGK